MTRSNSIARRACIAAAIVAGLSGCARTRTGGQFAEQPAASEAAVTPSAPASRDVASAVKLDARTPGWSLGHRYTYGVTLSTAVAFGNLGNAFDFELTGKLALTPTAVSDESVTLYASIADAKIQSRIAGTQAKFDELAQELQKSGCFFTLRGGRVTEMDTEHGLSAMVASAYRAIGAGIQFSRAADGSAHYGAEEYDTTGKYVARYDVEPGLNTWRKTKQRYLGILAAKTAPANVPARIVPEVVASSGHVELAPEGRPSVVRLHDEVLVKGAQAPIRSKTDLVLQSAAVETARTARDWNALLARMDRTLADEPYGSGAAVSALDDARTAGLEFSGVISRLEQLGAQPRPAPADPRSPDANGDDRAAQEKVATEDTQLFIALSAFFRKDPHTIAQALKMIESKAALADTLIDALGTASSSHAQQALIGLMGSKTLDERVRKRALFALSRTHEPTKEAVEALKRASSSEPVGFQRQALYGLGTYSRRLRDAGEADRANAIGEFLVGHLRRVEREKGDTVAIITALNAIGNSGYAPALSRVQPYVTDSDEIVRATAVRALQSMRDPKVDAILAARLRDDSASDVRKSAILAAQLRTPTDVVAGALEAAATGESNPHVRYRAVELMGRWVSERPNLRSTLERVAQKDAEARIRERAQAAL